MRQRQTEMECYAYEGNDAQPMKAPIERKKNEDISEIAISPSEAFAKFAGRALDQGAKVRATSGPALVTVHVQPAESALDRYRRLKASLDQFRAELQGLPKESPELTAVLLQETTALEGVLENLRKDASLAPFFNEPLLQQTELASTTSQLLGQLKQEAKRPLSPQPPPPPAASGPAGPTYELYVQQRVPESVDLLPIEKHLHALEQTIGIGQQCTFPDIQSGIVHLRRKLAILENPRELETIMRKVNNLLAELEALEEQKQQIAGAKASPHETAIHALYKAMPDWDEAAQQLPAIVARLQSIKDVCEQGAAAHGNLAALQKDQAQLDGVLGANQTAYSNLVAQLAAAMKQMEAGVLELDKKFGEAEKKYK